MFRRAVRPVDLAAGILAQQVCRAVDERLHLMDRLVDAIIT
jgi:hypothetical protein